MTRRRTDATAATPAAEATFGQRIVDWQQTHGRHHLPWQRQGADAKRDPYRVWLSEVMLQQTQVATALPYFERFLARFPDVASLAAAPLDAVLAQWSGLGYYSRARNLHAAAQRMVVEHGGRFPTTSESLATLPGVGRSTAAAIAAFSFGERVAILDGNVKRVLARVLAFDADLTRPAAVAALWDQATSLLPERDIGAYTQGLMDLGATVCLPRSPRCPICPVRDRCQAAASGTQDRYPVKTRRALRSVRETVWLDLRWRDRVLLVQRDPSGIWAGLWSLPEFEGIAALEAVSAGWPGRTDVEPPFVHVLTHLDWRLQPVRHVLAARTSARVADAIAATWPRGRWFGVDEALALGLPAPLRKRLVEGG